MDDTARLLSNPQPRATREHADQEYRLRHTRLGPLATRCLVRGWTTKTSSKRGIDFKLSRCGGQIFKCLPCRGKLSPGTTEQTKSSSFGATRCMALVWTVATPATGLFEHRQVVEDLCLNYSSTKSPGTSHHIAQCTLFHSDWTALRVQIGATGGTDAS